MDIELDSFWIHDKTQAHKMAVRKTQNLTEGQIDCLLFNTKLMLTSIFVGPNAIMRDILMGSTGVLQVDEILARNVNQSDSPTVIWTCRSKLLYVSAHVA
ncbi:hypothetical protein J6590_014104 [Homalodisca vitripennis]|nr:hypothetical protein J6590_014104 [Homalodisca vitripennis]